MKRRKVVKREKSTNWVTICIICTLILGAGAGFIHFNDNNRLQDLSHSVHVINTQTDASKPQPSLLDKGIQKIGQTLAGNNKPINVLLIANNARDAKSPLSLGTAGGQADIIMVVHVDPVQHRVVLISIPRDTLIALPEWKVTIPKIKTVFTLGLEQSPIKGPELEMNYISKMTGLQVHNYIVTDFQGFADAIDAIGGIQVDVKARLYDPQNSGVNLQPGVQTLNGAQALAYVRVRQNQAGNGYRVDDFQRQQAEVEVLKILKQKILDSTTNPVKLMDLAKVWVKDAATNLSNAQLVELGMESVGSRLQVVQLGSIRDSMEMAGTPFPGINQKNYLTGAYYDVLNPKNIADKLKPYGSNGSDLGLERFPEPKDVPILFYGSAYVANELKKDGFPVSYAGANIGKIARVTIYYPKGKITSGWRIARVIGSGNELVAPEQSPNRIHAIVYAP